MDILVVEDKEKCRALWDKFSSGKKIWELWDVVSCFTNRKNRFHFMVLMDEDKEAGLLPLMFDPDEDIYYYMGGSYSEDITFWFSLEHFPIFYRNLPGRTKIFDINAGTAEEIISLFPDLKQNFRIEDSHFFIDLKKKNHNIENYLETFNRKHRKNFRNDIKRLQDLSPVIKTEKMENFEKFVEYNIMRFGQESDLSDLGFRKNIKTLFEYLAVQGKLYTTAVYIGDRVAGLEFGAFHNHTFYTLNGGYDTSIRNLGKLIILEQIKKAIELRAETIDFLSGDTGGWKELWNCEKVPYYVFRKDV